MKGEPNESLKSTAAVVCGEANHQHYGTDGTSSLRQKAPPRWQCGLHGLKAFTKGQKTSNWEQTVRERDKTMTQKSLLLAHGQLWGPGLSLSVAPGPYDLLRPPQTSCDWDKRPRKITRSAAPHKELQCRHRTNQQSVNEPQRECEVWGGGWGRMQCCRLIWGQKQDNSKISNQISDHTDKVVTWETLWH